MLWEKVDEIETWSIAQIEAHMLAPSVHREPVSPRLGSAMMLNPLNLKHLNALDTLEAGRVILNLEDGVAPALKPRALALIRLALSHLKHSNAQIVIRVNPLDEGGIAEIQALHDTPPDAIRVAKIRTADDVAKALALLPPGVALHLSIETKEAFGALGALAIDPRVTTYYLGILDLLHSLGLPQSLLAPDNPTILAILSHFLLQTHLCGREPVGFVYQDYHDIEGFRRWCMLLEKMGYTAIGCLGPKQSAIAHTVFGLSAAQIARAEAIKAAFEAHLAEGVSGFLDVQLGFVDEPIYKDALATLAQAAKTYPSNPTI